MKLLVWILSFGMCVYYAFGSGFYKQNMADSEVFVISLQQGNPPTNKLITENKMIKTNTYRQNQHNIMLVKNKDFIALIDTGFPHTREVLESKLKEQGLTPSDITHIIITHGHRDHVGGILDNNQQNIFKNATLLVEKKEYEFWMHSQDLQAKNALNSFSKKEFFTKDTPILESLQFKITPLQAFGHTPGHTMILLEDSKNSKLLFVADLLHVYDVQKDNPQIAIEYDMHKDEAIKTRQEVLRMLKETNMRFVGTHFPSSEPTTLTLDIQNTR